MQVFHSLDDPRLVALIKEGAVGVLPTDTVYGLVCRAADEAAVKRLYDLKNRERKPGTIIAAKLQQLVDLGIRARYVKAVEDYWPAPLSVVVPTGDDLQYLHEGVHSLAVRVPKHKELQKLLTHTGALMTSSANAPGEPTAANLAEAQAYFGDKVDFYVDGGEIKDHEPSTVIRIVDDAIEVLRLGAVHIDENGRIQK